ncbi:phage tail tube protein [Serratia ficaria]|uniref:phage tail tube protein n=1 Tax=Serratia ficaria TaxID=61651 RepID=UPI0021833F9D|nr:hypothetical protein [Serratia ficaria]CAI2537435.1 Uncharacterised protein [Serratia ficaria]
MSDFYYGQGKLYLAHRNTVGQALSWRWVGDVSALALELEFDEKNTKMSVGGKLVTGQRYITSTQGKITSTWHEFSPENLRLLLGSKVMASPAEIISSETIPSGIQAGDRISLKHPNIWGVGISTLSEGVDYHVDPLWGVIDFMTTPEHQPLTVEYAHTDNNSLPLLNQTETELALRYEGINLAENKSPVIVEIYRVNIDPIKELSLINNDDNLGELETSALMLYDFLKAEDPLLGRLGRIVQFQRLSGITHNGVIKHNGWFTHRG